MLKRIGSLIMRREFAGLVLFLIVPRIFLNDLGSAAFVGYYLGVISTWIVYCIALCHRSPQLP